MDQQHLNGLNNDLLLDIMGQLDDSDMTSAGCTCSTLLHVAHDQSLWRQLCHSTWPSTALNEAQHLLSSSSFGGFHNIYYKNECVLSKVFNGIPEAVNVYHTDNTGGNCDYETNPNYHQYDEDNSHCDIDDNERYGLPKTLSDYGKLRDNHYKELAKHLRLSWVLLDKKKGKAVNLSRWKPLLIRRSWIYNGNYEIHFGWHLRWKEISTHIEDITGGHIGVQQSLLVMNQALYRLQSKNPLKVEQGYRLYEEKKREMMKKKAFPEKVADWLCMSIQITVFVICFVLPS
ncbi:hypothetical protein ACOSQ3_016894 [Xanthoceras sorbifolium]